MIRIRQIKIDIAKDNDQELKKKIVKRLNILDGDLISFDIKKKSIDARRKDNIYYIYVVDAIVKDEDKVLTRNRDKDILVAPTEEYEMPKKGLGNVNKRIVVVGSGPAGLFCSYLLAKNGYNPIILERGEKIDDRVKSVDNFWLTNKLNKNSNVQFGEGGAGTFSDGKLNTLVNDKFFRNKFVLETFVKHGAPEDILYLQKPHIGTDILRDVIVNMRKSIEKMGGMFRFNTCLTDIVIDNNELKSIVVNDEEIIECDSVVLAIGHSARDTFRVLFDKGLDMQSKPFAVGVRVEHPQKMISKSQYGDYYKLLPPASYKLTYTTKSGRGVYSFCMCPGGYVVNASSEEGRLAINGMSNYKRDSKNANSAVVVTVNSNDYGSDVFDGVKFQQKLEEYAYKCGNGSIPVQLWCDFKTNKKSLGFKDNFSEVKGNITFANLQEIFPKYISDSIMEAMPEFGKKIKGFDDPSTIMLGVESRTSSPVRIVRNDHFESNIKGIYPCGEGAGYAGGIMTAAMDGMKVAEEIISK
ncbi:MAG: NAD(P)/FAD-dependent oxidoreductase [Bacilli bacterium]|nr:NAD(P)/FAD-dependent oxidoreductase [Bacilli bacterium]